MKKMSLPEQRKLYKLYKSARIGQLNNLIHILYSGTYSKSSKEEMWDEAKKDILDFSSNFEESLIEEIKLDLE